MHVSTPGVIAFRPLVLDDLQLLHTWFSQPHVAAWYRDEAPLSYQEVVAKYAPVLQGQEPVRCFISYDDQPIGEIQMYWVADDPLYQGHIEITAGMAGIDVLIGEPAYIHRGLGAMILVQFLREVVFGEQGAASCLIDPEAANTVAIRCYEKAGFRYVTTAQLSPDSAPMYLMRIDATV